MPESAPPPHPARVVASGPGHVTGLLDAEVTCDYLVPLSVAVNVDTGKVIAVELHLEGFQQMPTGWFVGPNNHEITMRQAFVDGKEYADEEHPLADAALAIADLVDVHDPGSLYWTATPVPGGTIYANGHALPITEPQARDLEAAGFIKRLEMAEPPRWALGSTVTWDEIYARLGGRP